MVLQWLLVFAFTIVNSGLSASSRTLPDVDLEALVDSITGNDEYDEQELFIPTFEETERTAPQAVDEIDLNQVFHNLTYAIYNHFKRTSPWVEILQTACFDYYQQAVSNKLRYLRPVQGGIHATLNEFILSSLEEILPSPLHFRILALKGISIFIWEKISHPSVQANPNLQDLYKYYYLMVKGILCSFGCDSWMTVGPQQSPSL